MVRDGIFMSGKLKQTGAEIEESVHFTLLSTLSEGKAQGFNQPSNTLKF
jgi:TATA-box binding protein (TBP) (component of TFIID and TFIIIB)